MVASLVLKPKQFKEFATGMFRARKPFLVTSAPGQGKTDGIFQAADATPDPDDGKPADVILSHPVVSDPTDYKGYPFPNEAQNNARFLPFGELDEALKATRLTVWFFDDVGQSSPAVQAALMQLFLARRVNGHKLPDCVVLVAATNRRVDRAGVTGILEPVKSRFVTIVELVADVDDWCEWALENGVSAETVAFIRFRPELLSAFEPTADLTNSPTPRTNVHADQMLQMGFPKDIEAVAVAGAAGEGYMVERLAFRRMASQLPAIEGIIADPDSAPIPTEPAALYAVAAALGHRANPDNVANIGRYADRLVDAGQSDFAVLIVRDAERRDPSISSKAGEAWTRIACSKTGKAMSGEDY